MYIATQSLRCSVTHVWKRTCLAQRRLHSLVCPVLGITCDPFSNTSNGKDKDSNSRGDKEFALFAERSGSGCCVLLMGAEGCGKTHTLNRLSAHARTHGVFVVEVKSFIALSLSFCFHNYDVMKAMITLRDPYPPTMTRLMTV